MKYEVTSYTFFKVGNHYEYVKDEKRYTFSSEMMACMVTQYKLMGYMVVFDNDCFLSVAKVENAIEIFMEKLQKKA
jgi:hypothetical protein